MILSHEMIIKKDFNLTGEKYMGMWHNNNKHGAGMVVTMNGVYYEGNFTVTHKSGKKRIYRIHYINLNLFLNS